MSCCKVPTRIEILGRIKGLVEKNEHCSLARDVCTLINRELEILTRGTELSNELMEGLRLRLCNQFAKFVKKINADASKCSDACEIYKAKPKFRLHKPGPMRSRGASL